LKNRTALSTAIAAFAAFVVLGALVSFRPPGALDRWAELFFFGQATQLAAALTAAGTFPAYVTLCVAVLLAGYVRREWLPGAALAVGTFVVAWQTSDLFKAIFHRARPPHSLVYHETSASYPSGHAVLAMTFWGILAYYTVLALPPSRTRSVFVTAIVLWILGIGWSRLALGAHYLSDVAGGYLLGLGFVSIVALVMRLLEARGERL